MPEEPHTIEDLENTPAGRTLLLTQAMKELQGVVKTLVDQMKDRDKQFDGDGSEPGVLTRLALLEQKVGWFWAAIGAIGTASLAGVWELITSHIK